MNYFFVWTVPQVDKNITFAKEFVIGKCSTNFYKMSRYYEHNITSFRIFMGNIAFYLELFCKNNFEIN